MEVATWYIAAQKRPSSVSLDMCMHRILHPPQVDIVTDEVRREFRDSDGAMADMSHINTAKVRSRVPRVRDLVLNVVEDKTSRALDLLAHSSQGGDQLPTRTHPQARANSRWPEGRADSRP